MIIFGLAWWLFAIEAFIILGMLFSMNFENPLAPLLLAIVGVAAFYFFGGGDPISWVSANWYTLGGYALGYLIIGAGWCIFKWIRYTDSDEMQSKIRNAYDDWESSKSTTPFEESSYYPFGFKYDFPVISNWALFWPFSFVLTLTKGIFVDLLTWVGRQFSGFFAWIARRSVQRAIKKA